MAGKQFGNVWHIFKGILTGFVLSLAGLAIGLISIMGTASVTSIPVLFLSSGAIVYGFLCLVSFRWIYLRTKRPEWLRSASAVSVILFLAAAFSLLKPFGGQYHNPVPVNDLRYWELPTGSKIAYAYMEGKGPKQPYPIVFLHGGPGTPDMAGDLRYFGKLAEQGYDFYIYDQSGSGHSSRLKDPAKYTVSKDVDELEAIRQVIGAERMILIGHSNGSNIIAHYLVSHENHVDKTVFISPGSINPSDRSNGNLTGRLDKGQRLRLYRELMRPRGFFTYALLQINPKAAHAFAGDREMDARNDRIYAATESALHAKGKRYEHPVYGLGFYALQMPQSRTAPAQRDIRPIIEGMQVPALIIKGSEDYLSWSSAMDYRRALPHSELVYIEEAGHNVYQDQPGLVMESIKSFLKDREILPLPYEGEMPPASFQGAP